MPVVKLPGRGNGWRSLRGAADAPPAMFEKADGTFLDLDGFDERLKDQARRAATTNRVGTVRPGPAPLAATQLAALQNEEEPAVSTVSRAEPEQLRQEPTARQKEVWDAVQRLGSQTAAARELHTTQGAIQSALKGYMARVGLTGDLPGKLSPEAKHEAIVAGAHSGGFNGAPKIGVIRGDRELPAMEMSQPAETQPEPASNMVETYVSVPVESPTGDLMPTFSAPPSQSPEATADSGIDFDDFDPIVWGSLYWLAEHGHNWTQEQAEKWLRGFTAALDLAYPTAA